MALIDSNLAQYALWAIDEQVRFGNLIDLIGFSLCLIHLCTFAY